MTYNSNVLTVQFFEAFLEAYKKYEAYIFSAQSSGRSEELRLNQTSMLSGRAVPTVEIGTNFGELQKVFKGNGECEWLLRSLSGFGDPIPDERFQVEVIKGLSTEIFNPGPGHFVWRINHSFKLSLSLGRLHFEPDSFDIRHENLLYRPDHGERLHRIKIGFDILDKVMNLVDQKIAKVSAKSSRQVEVNPRGSEHSGSPQVTTPLTSNP